MEGGGVGVLIVHWSSVGGTLRYLEVHFPTSLTTFIFKGTTALLPRFYSTASFYDWFAILMPILFLGTLNVKNMVDWVDLTLPDG